MKTLRRAVVVGLAALAACRTPTADAPERDSAPRGASAQALAAVQPEFLSAFEELQRALAAGDDVVARSILRGIQARSPTGAALSLAQAFERILAGREAVSELHIALVARTRDNVPPAAASATPGITPPAGAVTSSADAAVTGGADATVTPSASAPVTASAAGPIQDSPAAPVTPASPSTSAEQTTSPRMEAWLLFVVENTSTVPIELRPGPANLQITKTSVGRLKSVIPGSPPIGGEQQSSETHPYPELGNLALAPGRALEIELARFFIDVPDDELAVRLAFDLDLRSGSIVRDGRELPAMNVPVKGCEATRWSRLRYPQLEPTPEGLEEYVVRTNSITADGALELAVRMPPEERDRALDRLAGREREISEVHLEELVPALRWLTEDPTLGGDAGLWRAYLRARARAKTKDRPKLELPVR